MKLTMKLFTLTVLLLSAHAFADENKIVLTGSSAQRVLNAFYDLQVQNVGGAIYYPSSAQADRPAMGAFDGEISISCTGAEGKEKAECEMTLKPYKKKY